MDLIDDILSGVFESGEEVNTSRGLESKKSQTKEALLLAMKTQDYHKLKELYYTGFFRGKTGIEAKKLLRNLIHALYGNEISDYCKNWCNTTPLREELDDREHWEDFIDILNKTLISGAKMSILAENPLDYLQKLIPSLSKRFLETIALESEVSEEKRAIILGLRQEVVDLLFKEYPKASNRFKNCFFSKKYPEDFRAGFLERSQSLLTSYLEEKINLCKQNSKGDDLELWGDVFEELFSFLVPGLGNLGSVYFDQMCVDMKEQIVRSHNKNSKIKGASQEGLDIENKKSELLFSSLLKDKISQEHKELIDTTVNAFSLGDREKKGLKKKLMRLIRNAKPFKIQDYVDIISPVDEGRLMDLVEDLGLKLWEEQTKPSMDLKQGEKQIEDGLQLQDFEKGGVVENERVVFNLEASDVDLVYEIINHIESLGYRISNPKKLIGQFMEFLRSSGEKKSVLAALGNPDIMNKRVRKIGQTYAISLTPKVRILLIKDDNTWSIDGFFADHDDYEDRIDAIK